MEVSCGAAHTCTCIQSVSQSHGFACPFPHDRFLLLFLRPCFQILSLNCTVPKPFSFLHLQPAILSAFQPLQCGALSSQHKRGRGPLSSLYVDHSPQFVIRSFIHLTFGITHFSNVSFALWRLFSKLGVPFPTPPQSPL